MAVIYLPMTKLIVVLSTIHRNVLWHSNRFQLIIYEKLLILLLFEKLMHGYTGWSWNRLNVFVTVHLAGHCIELSLNPFFHPQHFQPQNWQSLLESISWRFSRLCRVTALASPLALTRRVSWWRFFFSSDAFTRFLITSGAIVDPELQR